MTGSQQLILGEGAGGSGVANYIEDVFSTYLYTGTNAAQTITNGIDLSTYGGLVWTKSRDDGSLYHVLSDSATGPNNILRTNSSNAPFTYTAAGWSVPVFNANGYTTSDSGYVTQNAGGFNKFVSWTFRKQPKFFDVVTYTGNGVAGRTVAHSLGSVPGCIIVKNVSSSASWEVYHRSIGPNSSLRLNSSNGVVGNTNWNNTAPTSTVFTVGAFSETNSNGDTYVAYLFAHNAGGFGLTGTDNVISCGSYTGTGAAGNTITLGYEPQWVLIKRTDAASSWNLADTMRGMPADGFNNRVLYPNLSSAENGLTGIGPTATGFTITSTDSDYNGGGASYIYIAIRRGPMKTPTTGTSVFNPSTWVGGSGKTTGFPLDSLWVNYLPGYSGNTEVYARLIKASSTTTQSNGGFLSTSSTAAEDTTNSGTLNWSNTGYGQPQGSSNIYYAFRRAPGFFDVVCYTGNGVARTINHNLGVAPELMIIKARSSGGYGWPVYAANPGPTQFAYLDDTSSFSANSTAWNDTAPTASVFTVGTGSLMNTSSVTYVAYLFASCPGVSKVGSYTGTGALQTINCGFTGGARFVLIKRTDASGYGWFVYDSANGISSGNDPYILFNSAGAQVTGTNYVDTTSVGFQVTAAAPAGLNANGGTYIFLAIA